MGCTVVVVWMSYVGRILGTVVLGSSSTRARSEQPTKTRKPKTDAKPSAAHTWAGGAVAELREMGGEG